MSTDAKMLKDQNKFSSDLKKYVEAQKCLDDRLMMLQTAMRTKKKA